jgi:hypothetical protein
LDRGFFEHAERHYFSRMHSENLRIMAYAE